MERMSWKHFSSGPFILTRFVWGPSWFALSNPTTQNRSAVRQGKNFYIFRYSQWNLVLHTTCPVAYFPYPERDFFEVVMHYYSKIRQKWNFKLPDFRNFLKLGRIYFCTRIYFFNLAFFRILLWKALAYACEKRDKEGRLMIPAFHAEIRKEYFLLFF